MQNSGSSIFLVRKNSVKYRILLLVILLLTAIVFLVSSVKTREWWYPFVSFSFGDTFTAGPMGFTSNVREDNPIWKSIPDMNRSFARTTYVMTRGKPDADIAWLMMDAEWPDKVAIAAGIEPNKSESAISREITRAGFVYDRISRNNLLQVTINKNYLQIGAMQYKALLVDDMHVTSPELLVRVKQIIESGIPVIWLGELPARAVGWKDHEQRDREVADLRESIVPGLHRVKNTREALTVLRDKKIVSPLIELTSESGYLRTQRRKSGNTTFILLFNDSHKNVSLPIAGKYDSKEIQLLNPEDGTITNVSEYRVIPEIPAGRTRILQIGSASTDWDSEEWNNPSIVY